MASSSFDCPLNRCVVDPTLEHGNEFATPLELGDRSNIPHAIQRLGNVAPVTVFPPNSSPHSGQISFEYLFHFSRIEASTLCQTNYGLGIVGTHPLRIGQRPKNQPVHIGLR